MAHCFSHCYCTQSRMGYSKAALQTNYAPRMPPQKLRAEGRDPITGMMSTDIPCLGQDFCLLPFISVTIPLSAFCGHCSMPEVSALHLVRPSKVREPQPGLGEGSKEHHKLQLVLFLLPASSSSTAQKAVTLSSPAFCCTPPERVHKSS